MSDNISLLLARILLVVLFLVSGAGMLAGPGGVAGYFGSLGIPLPGLVVWLVIALKIVGALAVLAGLGTRYAALALAAFCVGAGLIGHLDLLNQNETTQLLKDLAIAGGLVALSVSGPGAISLDARRA